MSILFLITLTVLIAYGVFGPVICKGSRGYRHNALFIFRGDPGGGNYGPAGMKQEKGEWRVSHFIGLLVATPVAMQITMPIISTVMLVSGTFIVSSMMRLIELFDYAGHGAEIIEAERLNVVTIKGPNGPGSDSSVIATGEIRTVDYYEAKPGDYVTYRQGEIARMIRFDEREDMTPEEVEPVLDRYKWLSKVMHRIS